ncbi:S41 family peptidase [Flagellimonas sp. 2504JD1-5]
MRRFIEQLCTTVGQKWNNGLWQMPLTMGSLRVAIYGMVLDSDRFGIDYIIRNSWKDHNLLNKPLFDIIFHKTSNAINTLGLFFIFGILSCSAQDYQVTLSVNTNALDNVNKAAVVGNISPLSWDKDYPMTDEDGDGIYQVTIPFKTSKRALQFKFKVNDELELQGSNNRALGFNDPSITKDYVFNEFNFYDKEKVVSLTYTSEQIEEDVDILKKIIQHVHPAIYKFRDSVSLQNDFKLLEDSLKANPSLTNAYGAISKTVAKVKCSHTFTNPWNQGYVVGRALFSQHDKIPFTFNRIGKRLFIDKNASENNELKKGLEILSINGVSTDQVLSKLAHYITSDGSNYEKKLERLLVTGEEKFSLFDIFFPIEFGSAKTFQLQLKDISSQETFEATVKAISKTNRTRRLVQRYGELAISLQEGWNFEIINNNTAKLAIKSFAVHRNEFDWKGYLDNVFKELNEKSIANFIVDIRGNEGGQGEVGEYILERIIEKPLQMPPMQASVRYVTIPIEFKKHISTWDKFPYDFSGKYSHEQNGRYMLKEKYSVKGKTYKPKKDGFKGDVYLMIDASNSSATHLMAMYAKKLDNVTLVGQETGGNKMGTNGSFIFFLRLPNTKIVVDIPVVNMYVPTGEVPLDGGVKPNMMLNKNPYDLVKGVDTELNGVLELIKTK